MPDDTTLRATIATLTAAGLDVGITRTGSTVEVVITDAGTGERYVCRGRDVWTALVEAGTAAGFEFDDHR